MNSIGHFSTYITSKYRMNFIPNGIQTNKQTEEKKLNEIRIPFMFSLKNSSSFFQIYMNL